MVEDLFSGLLECLADFVLDVVFEGIGEILNGIADWFNGGQPRGDEGKAVERDKCPPEGSGG